MGALGFVNHYLIMFGLLFNKLLDIGCDWQLEEGGYPANTFAPDFQLL